VYSNGLNNAGTEADGRNGILVQAALEVGSSSGKILPVTFDGLRSVLIEPGGMAVSDPVGVILTKGTAFQVRQYVTGYGVSFTDGVSNSTTTYTSATAAFTQADVGRSIVGTDIPAGTRIAAVASASSITLSATATGTNSGLTFVVGRPALPSVTGPTGMKWNQNCIGSTSGLGEALNANTNLVTAGTVTNGSGNQLFGPSAILGVPATSGQPVIGIIGDSIIAGLGESSGVSTPQPAPGYWIRALNNNYSFVHVAMSSDGASLWNASVVNIQRRIQLLDWCTHFIVALGTNGQGTAQADLTTLFATLAAYRVPIWVSTIIPRTTSSDSWATTANQTVTANEAARVSTNAFIRGVPTNVTGFFEAADAVETARDSGKWQSVGSGLPAAITADGVHPNTAGHTQIAASTAFGATPLANAFGAVSV
jgi:lysophospholipase L1-like esterase